MKKKVLIVACVPVMIKHFNMPNIRMLQEMRYQVEVAFNCFLDEMWSEKDWKEFKKQLDVEEIPVHQIDFTRSAGNIARHLKAYKQLKALVEQEKYEFIHCHTPIAAAIARIVAHRTGTRIIYTAHGFHFFDGAPLKNWVLYYPIEKILSKWTDCLIVINKEDYYRAKRKFHAKRTEYVPGVGIDLEKIEAVRVNREEKRKEIGIPDNAYMLLSVGELIVRKNHKLMFHALCELRDENVYYVICGQGELEKEFKEFVRERGLDGKVRLLGYRSDVIELCKTADLFVFPSLQEGLPVALMEAMASGVPCIASDIRGNKDLLKECGTKCLLMPEKPEAWEECIQYYVRHSEEIKKLAIWESKRIEAFSIDKVMRKIKEIYKRIE